MQVHIETELPVDPAVYWPRMFFDAEFNAGLHRELGFLHYAVVSEVTRADGCIERMLETEPPLTAPEVVKRHLGRALRITEQGVFDPATALYTFTHTPAIAIGSTRIAGTIRVAARPHGLVHLVDVGIAVSAFGLGALIERSIEKSVRESYAVMGRYGAAFAATHGFAHAQA